MIVLLFYKMGEICEGVNTHNSYYYVEYFTSQPNK